MAKMRGQSHLNGRTFTTIGAAFAFVLVAGWPDPAFCGPRSRQGSGAICGVMEPWDFSTCRVQAECQRDDCVIACGPIPDPYNSGENQVEWDTYNQCTAPCWDAYVSADNACNRFLEP